MTQLAIIKTGGKQYIVGPGQKIDIEKLGAKEGETVIFNEVLLLEKNDKTGKKVEIGNPFIENANVLAKVLAQKKGKKVIAFKYKPKTRYKRKKGHRQLLTEVEITKIEG